MLAQSPDQELVIVEISGHMNNLKEPGIVTPDVVRLLRRESVSKKERRALPLV